MDIPARSTTDLSRAVATEIRVLLLRRNMNQAQLAERMGVNEVWVSRRLRGAQQLDLNDLQRIADVLDVAIADLLPTSARQLNDRLAQTVGTRPHPVDVRSPGGATRRRPKIRQTLTGHPIATRAA